MYVGLDIGSVSVNAVLMDDELRVREDHYVRTHGEPFKAALAALQDLLSRTPAEQIEAVATTGTGARRLADFIGGYYVNEIIAQSKATGQLYPQVRTIIELGGEDSKLILLERDAKSGVTVIRDFAMNTVCAAGTGSFLDQQAARLGVSIEEEFGSLALRSPHPPRIAGRCSVFAKTDMIHLQQQGAPDYDIVAGLCFALARNFCGNIAQGKEFEPAISFQGGVAGNRGMISAFEAVLELGPGELLIPRHHASMGAIGAVYALRESGAEPTFRGLAELEACLRERRSEAIRHSPLQDDGYEPFTEPEAAPAGKVRAYLGVDVGSISTNVVVVDENDRVLARRYLMTAGRPIEAVRQGIAEVGEEIGDRVEIAGCATTGSGRYLIGDFIGSDLVKNEITTHARAAAQVDPRVDTVFEIGGQDSKFISLENGAIVDFAMNKVCAAGTGSFLEEQAEKLGINIVEEFGQLALGSGRPVRLGERCTVFMESDLNRHQQKGMPKDDLVAGLAYSIVLNYLNKVVERRKVGDVVFFQGGVAANRGVKAAFESVLGKKVTVPPHHDVIGAIGAAILAREQATGQPSRFKGFDLAKRHYTLDSFECTECPNRCEIHRVRIEDEPPLHYGSRCGKFDEVKRTAGRGLERLFQERQRMLLHTYEKRAPDAPVHRSIGIPRTMIFFELYPTWKAFFTELGYDVVLSEETSRQTIHQGVESVAAETCFPVKVAHGHVLNLLEHGVDYLFLPSVVDMEHLSPGMHRSYCCPYIQSLPFLLEAGLDLERQGVKVLRPTLYLSRGWDHTTRILRQLGRELGHPGAVVRQAIAAAREAQGRFYAAMEERGREVLRDLPPDQKAMVIVSRPYNGCDPALNLNLPEKLRDLGVLAIPMDFLPLRTPEIADEFPHMYWKYGQRIVSAGKIIAGDPRLHAIYITNFGCGPDSFIAKFFQRTMGEKPYLTIEVDEHSADVGAITRCEAFLDSLAGAPAAHGGEERSVRAALPNYLQAWGNGRVLYIPHMDDHGHIVAAAMRRNGMPARPLPMADEESVRIARAFTSGKECYPCIITSGDILKKATSPDFNPEQSAFLMPTSVGPCRFGQYNKFHRMLLDDLGFEEVPIVCLDQTASFHEDLRQLGPQFRRVAWRGMVGLDYIQKLLRQIRPYEQEPGTSERAYARWRDRLTQAVENGQAIAPISRDARKDFERIPVDRTRRRPLIGIVGEIFVRMNRFANDFIETKIEAVGGEIAMPPFEEWLDYIDWARREDYLREKRFSLLGQDCLAELVQKWDRARVARQFRGAIDHFFHEAPTRAVLRRARPYLPSSIRGEAVLSMGRAVEYVEHGFDGIVNLAPFNCLPGTIVNALLRRFRQDHHDVPVLKMAYDGLQQANEDTRIEAFLYQARQFMERKRSHAQGKGLAIR